MCIFQYLKRFTKVGVGINFIFLFFIVTSCNSNKRPATKKIIKNYQKYLNEFKVVYPNIDNNWNIVECYDDPYGVYLSLEKSTGDAVHNLEIKKNVINNSNSYSTNYSITRYIIATDKHHVRLSNESISKNINDTLFHYYYNDGEYIDGTEIFIKGKWYYYYNMNILTKDLQKYYKNNKDSLNLIKGNPTISK